MNRRMLSVCLATCFALGVAGAARGEEVGVSEHTVLIDRLTPRGSPNFAGMAKQRTEGADAYIASVNAAGGVHGRRVVLKDRDDAYDRERASREIKALIVRYGPSDRTGSSFVDLVMLGNRQIVY